MKVKIYTKTGCPYCIGATTWFKQNEINYDETVIDNIQDRNSFYKKMNENDEIKEHIRTVPQIFIDDIHIGGYSDLQSISKNILSKK